MSKIVPIIIAGMIFVTAVNAGAVPYITGEPYMGDNVRIDSSKVGSIDTPNCYTSLVPTVPTSFSGSSVLTLSWNMYFNGSRFVTLKLNWAIFNSRQSRVPAIQKMNRLWALENWSLKAMDSWQPERFYFNNFSCFIGRY